MIMKRFILFSVACMLLLSFWGCGSINSFKEDSCGLFSAQSRQIPQEMETEIVQSENPDTILITKLSDGKIHEYYHVCSEDYLHNIHTRIRGEKNEEVISFIYDRYDDNDSFYDGGFPRAIRYVVSKDKKSIFVVGSVLANSNGWITEYQIFKLDVETNKTKCIVECAAIEAVSDGFVVAQARLANEKTATCTADEKWLLHDEKIDFDGNVVDVSRKEYGYDKMTKRFHSDDEEEFVYLKGFKKCF